MYIYNYEVFNTKSKSSRHSSSSNCNIDTLNKLFFESKDINEDKVLQYIMENNIKNYCILFHNKTDLIKPECRKEISRFHLEDLLDRFRNLRIESPNRNSGIKKLNLCVTCGKINTSQYCPMCDLKSYYHY